jgi:DNA-binding transcriptional LysR family regulator
MSMASWSSLGLRHLVALMAVADEGSFAGAAERLGYSQAAISQQIAALERIVGVRLIQRTAGRRPDGITSAGHVLRQHAEAVVTTVRSVQAELAKLTTRSDVGLRIGTCTSMGSRVLPQVTRGFLTRMPDTVVDLLDGPSEAALFGLVENGELDVAFAGLTAVQGTLEAVELLVDPYALVVPADSALAERAEVASADLGDLALIGFRSCLDMPYVEEQLRSFGVLPRWAFRTDDISMLCALVLAGVGYGLVPKLAVDPNDSRLVALLIAGLRPRNLGAIHCKGADLQNEALRVYLEMARSYCASIQERLLSLPP